MNLQWFLSSRRSPWGCHLRCAPTSPQACQRWRAFASLLRPPSTCGGSACTLGLFSPWHNCLCQLLFCKCPSLRMRATNALPRSGVMLDLFLFKRPTAVCGTCRILSPRCISPLKVPLQERLRCRCCMQPRSQCLPPAPHRSFSRVRACLTP